MARLAGPFPFYEGTGRSVTIQVDIRHVETHTSQTTHAPDYVGFLFLLAGWILVCTTQHILQESTTVDIFADGPLHQPVSSHVLHK
jgi:hypothetical protein